jgi:hypothetical protein
LLSTSSALYTLQRTISRKRKRKKNIVYKAMLFGPPLSTDHKTSSPQAMDNDGSKDTKALIKLVMVSCD